MTETPTFEHHLDPTDWGELAELAHRALDDTLAHLRTVRDRPVWQRMPETVRRRLATPPPWDGEGLESAYAKFLSDLRPYALGNVHPRFWGWVPGSGTAGGIVAELVKAGLNTVPAAFDEVGRILEQQVMAWMLEVFGMPATGSGILVSGGSMANFVGLAVGRDARAGFDLRREGLSAAPRPLTFYASVETHNSVDKSAHLLGLGHQGLRKIPVDRDHRIELDALRDAILSDRRSGRQPAVVVGNAGTVNVGAVDDLSALADLCAEEGLWLHVDGAFGAIAALSPELRPQLAGLERVDSLAFDFHKWLHVQYSAGCTLFRDEEAHGATFAAAASYLSEIGGGPAAVAKPSHRFGPELSREAKALKIWMSLREHGLAKFGELALQNARQARHLAALAEAEPRLEVMAPVPLNITCLRYLPADREPEWIDEVNRQILIRLQENGIAVPSHTLLDGRFAIRVCITSHRTELSDLELVVGEILRLGGEVERELAATPALTRG